VRGTIGRDISLFEEQDGEPVFRWHALKGRFTPFTGTTIPRHFSPCCVVLDQRKPILVKEPERLLYPYLALEGAPVGTLWIMTHEQERHFTQDDCDTLLRLAAFGSVGGKAADRAVPISMIHTRLYTVGDMNAIKIGAYLRDLCVDLTASENGRAAVCTLKVEVQAPEALSLPPDVVTKLGLIVNEFVTNNFKHAAGSTHCRIAVTQSADTLGLTISDDGPGLPVGFGEAPEGPGHAHGPVADRSDGRANDRRTVDTKRPLRHLGAVFGHQGAVARRATWAGRAQTAPTTG
jgi:hypothetical protein